MSSHSNCDLQQPPPSAQRSSWAPPADVRSDGTARRRPIARHRDEIPSSKGDGVARMAKNTASPSRAMTIANPSVEQRPSTTQSDHIPSSRMNTSTKCGNGKAQPLQSSTSSSAVANPTRTVFDPWNSASTGHQRAENRLLGSTSWRDSRNLKLREQYRGGLGGGGKRVADTVGAGSEECGKDGRKANGGWERGAKGLRTGRQRSLVEVWGASKVGSAKRSSQEEKEVKLEEARSESESGDGLDDDMATNEEEPQGPQSATDRELSTPVEKQIFEGLYFYLNGSTAPLVSDHKLKHMLASHGAGHSVALGRRTVTHVILGTVSGQGGCGGGLAASKIQKEIARSGGKGVKFVTAEWVLASIKAERRLPESRFSPLKLAPKSQNTVFSMMRSSKPSAG